MRKGARVRKRSVRGRGSKGGRGIRVVKGSEEGREAGEDEEGGMVRNGEG